jgi:hypothetical protein
VSDQTPEQIANAMLTKGTFNFADALRGRTYATEEVDVYLDEATAYPLLDVDGRLAFIDKKVSTIDPEKLGEQFAVDLLAKQAEVQAERVAITEALKGSRFVFTIKGVDGGTVEDLRKAATDMYPIEYGEYYNNPITGERLRDELPNPERDKYFTNTLWQAHILKIVAPDGSEDSLPPLETIAAMRRILPNASRFALEQAIGKVDMAVNWYGALADEVFLAKS